MKCCNLSCSQQMRKATVRCSASSSVRWWLFLCGRKGTFVEERLRFKIEFELDLWGCDVGVGLGASSI